jgi:Protein of unknown function (DUF2924)
MTNTGTITLQARPRKPSLRAVAERIQSLNMMPLSELRTLWEENFGSPPKHRATDMLRRVLAWRLQVELFGGLDAATIRMLESERTPIMVAEPPGTRLARDYAGRRHEVVVADDGVIYDGARFNSLSEVARKITGQRWNGPRFFGLRRENSR